MDTPIASNLSIQPGLSLQGKGTKSLITDNADNLEANDVSLLYIVVSVNFVYYLPLTSGDIFFGASLYVVIGISTQVRAAYLFVLIKQMLLL